MGLKSAPFGSGQYTQCAVVWRLTAHYSALCRGYRRFGAELASCASHTRCGWFIIGAEQARYGKHHTPLPWGLERAELVGGGQWAEPRALRCAGVGSPHVAGRFLPPLEHPRRFSLPSLGVPTTTVISERFEVEAHIVGTRIGVYQ